MIGRLIGLLLLLVPCVAHAKWYEASSKHFVVYYEGEADAAKNYATRLERFDKGMRVLRGFGDPELGPANRVTVFVLSDKKAVGKLAGDRYIAGWYSPRAGNSVAFVPRFSGVDRYDLSAQAVMFHEYAHHLMFGAFSDSALPAWLTEGYAEFHATARFDGDGALVFGGPPNYRGWGLVQGPSLSVKDLLTKSPAKLGAVKADVFYGRAWLLTHLLSFDKKRDGQLAAYIGAINSGTPIAEAARAFGDLRKLDSELEHYLKQPKIRGIILKPDRLPIGPVAVRALTAGEAATMGVRIRSQAGVDEKSAPRVYADAKKAAAPYPDDAAAQVVLAETAIDAGDYAGCIAAANRAIAADPKAVRGYVFLARARMALAREAGDRKHATWEAIRKTIGTGNRHDPNNPEPLVLFYESFPAEGLTPNANAVDALLMAHALAPQDRSLRWMVTLHYLEVGKLPEARRALIALAYSPHGGANTERAAQVLAAIDAGEAGAALALARGGESEAAADPAGSDGDGADPRPDDGTEGAGNPAPA